MATLAQELETSLESGAAVSSEIPPGEEEVVVSKEIPREGEGVAASTEIPRGGGAAAAEGDILVVLSAHGGEEATKTRMCTGEKRKPWYLVPMGVEVVKSRAPVQSGSEGHTISTLRI